MKINSVSPVRYYAGSIKNTPKFNQTVNYNSIQFSGLFDVFKKNLVLTPEQQASNDIDDLVKSAKKGQKALKSASKVFFVQLNEILNMGASKDYKGYFPYVNSDQERKNVTFSEVDKELGVPSSVNIWQNGRVKTVYEVYSLQPQSAFKVTDYKEDAYTEYSIVNKQCVGYSYVENSGLVIQQFLSNDGFYQHQLQKIDDKSGTLLSELYVNTKSQEKSRYLEDTEVGLVEFIYDKNKKMWVQNGILNPADYVSPLDNL